jgi:hypothetical protein
MEVRAPTLHQAGTADVSENVIPNLCSCQLCIATTPFHHTITMLVESRDGKSGCGGLTQPTRTWAPSVFEPN